MGRGRSGANGGSGSKIPTANTPSGISYDQFMQMPEAQRFQVMDNLIADPNIVTPNYLDDSDATKVKYALGIDDRPTVVSDSQLDNIQGREIFRTVYEEGSMPPPSSDAILDQIRTGQHTQFSGSGGSAHGRAIYFATNFTDSADYGDKSWAWRPRTNVMIMRGKINPNAKIVAESTIRQQMQSKGYRSNSRTARTDDIALYAISQGIDGWYSGSYTMIVNRKNLTMSTQNKRISKRNTKGPTSRTANSWSEAAKAR